MGRNHAAGTLCAITELGRNGQLSLSTHFHALDTLVPSFDDSPGSKRKREWLAPVHGTVELGPIFKPACVMHGDGLPRLCRQAGADRKIDILQSRRRRDFFPLSAYFLKRHDGSFPSSRSLKRG